MKTKLTEMWQEYEDRCIPEVPKDSVQYRETKRAFMAGAVGMFEGLQWLTVNRDELTVMTRMNEIELEAKEWLTEYIVLTNKKRNA